MDAKTKPWHEDALGILDRCHALAGSISAVMRRLDCASFYLQSITVAGMDPRVKPAGDVERRRRAALINECNTKIKRERGKGK